ncbi:MAG: adenylate kinase, partial [Muribaculaceae bacterium]|nr:adenylate kinase [Muribaculaceae bacterium]
SKNYIKTNFRDIIKYANVIEERIDDSDYSIDSAIEDNFNVLKQCQVHDLPYVLIDTEYDVDISLP